MSFLAPKAPAAPAMPPPPPNAPTQADASVQDGGVEAQRAAAAAAGQFGSDGTVKTSPQGATSPNTATKTLLGQ